MGINFFCYFLLSSLCVLDVTVHFVDAQNTTNETRLNMSETYNVFYFSHLSRVPLVYVLRSASLMNFLYIILIRQKQSRVYLHAWYCKKIVSKAIFEDILVFLYVKSMFMTFSYIYSLFNLCPISVREKLKLYQSLSLNFHWSTLQNKCVEVIYSYMDITFVPFVFTAKEKDKNITLFSHFLPLSSWKKCAGQFFFPLCNIR